MVLVRNFRKKDLEKVTYIAEVSLTEEYSDQLFLALNNAENTIFLVAEMNNTVVGFLSSIANKDEDARILMLAVHPFYRNRGIGSSLLSTFQEICISNGIKRITLEVRPSNKRAIEFYRKRGFYSIEILEDFYTNGEKAIKMLKTF